MFEDLTTQLVVEENVRCEWPLTNGTVQPTLHFQDEGIGLVWLGLKFWFLDGAVTASDLWSVAVDVVDRVISEASVLVSGLLVDLLMEVINILSHQRDLFPSPHQFFQYFIQNVMTLRGIGVDLLLIVLPHKFPHQLGPFIETGWSKQYLIGNATIILQVYLHLLPAIKVLALELRQPTRFRYLFACQYHYFLAVLHQLNQLGLLDGLWLEIFIRSKWRSTCFDRDDCVVDLLVEFLLDFVVNLGDGVQSCLIGV